MYSSNAQPTGTNRPRACLYKPSTNTTNALCVTHVPASTNQATSHDSTPPTPTDKAVVGPGCGHGVHRVTAAIAAGKHPVPSRTRKLSLPAPMVLQSRGCGRVGRRRTTLRRRATRKGRPSVICAPLPTNPPQARARSHFSTSTGPRGTAGAGLGHGGVRR